MKYTASVQNWISSFFSGKKLPVTAIFTAGAIVLYLLILFFARILATKIPLLATGLSWIWFLMPGLLVYFFFARNSSWWERIPIGFVLSIGIATPLTIAAILMHLSLDTFVLLHAASFILFATTAIILTIIQKPFETKSSSLPKPKNSRFDPSSALLLLGLFAFVGVLSILALRWPIVGDDTAILPLFSDVLSQNRITGTEPFHGSEVPVTPRNELIVATYLEILTNKISGTTPQDFIANSRPILVIMAMLSLAVLLNQYLRNGRQTLFLLNIWSIYLLATTQADSTGGDFITRIFQDKFLGWFIIVPIALVFMLRFIESGELDKLIGFGIVVMGASMVHPITLTQVMILAGGFGLVHYAINRTKVVFKNLVFIAVVLLLSTFIPFIQYIRFTNYMPVDLVGLGDAVEFGRLSSAINRYRLWLLDGGRYILHPSIILQPFIIVAYVLLPLIVTRLRKNKLSQLIVGALFLLPVLLYVPFFAALAGKVVTPYLLWRLAWPIPLFAILAIGSAAWQIFHMLYEKMTQKGYRSSTVALIFPGLILMAFLAAMPTIREGLQFYDDRRTEVRTTVCFKAGSAFSFLAEITREKSANVLSSHQLNLCIPGYAPNANVVEFRGYGTINRLSYDNIEESIRRVEDVNYFSTARLIDDLLMNAIKKHGIDYVLIEKDRLELDLQFKYLSESFLPVYEDTNFSLYSVQNLANESIIVNANTAMRLKQYDLAKDLYFQVLEEKPENVLALLGIGLAEEVSGNSSQAIAYFQKSIISAPYEPALHAQLASAQMLRRNFEKSVDEYQIAVRLSPERSSLHKALGEIYVLLDKKDEALKSFERFASFQSVHDSAEYYSTLGRSLQTVDSMKDKAIVYQDRALSIQPETKRYIDLARTWMLLDETEKAINELEKAIQWDQWNYLPHLELAYIYRSQGDIDAAIRELEIACQLNPANVSAYILLGMLIHEQSGFEAALERLEALKEVNIVLPGPYRSYAILMASKGIFDSSMEALDRSAVIQPRSAAVLTSKGYISMVTGQLDVAYAAFEQALHNHPDLISAKLGLGKYYSLESNAQLEAAQFLEIVQLVPATSWIHQILAEMYTQQGDYQPAIEEINWAIRLDADNPESYITRGNIHRMQSNWSQAISDYSIARELDPQNYTALISLGEIYQDQGRYSEAEDLFQIASNYHPESVYPVIRLSDLYWQLGRFEEAAELEDAARKIAPDSEPVLLKLASSYKKQGKIDEARSIYTQIIGTSPDVISAHIGLAQLVREEDNDLTMLYSIYNDLLGADQGSAEVYLTVGEFLITQAQFEQAEQILTTALSFSNVSIDNYLALSQLQQRLGKNDASLTTLETAVKIFPGEAKAFNSLASYHLEKGSFQKADYFFDKTIAIDPGLIPAYVGKSQMKQVAGDITSAEQILQNAVQMNPGSSDAILALAAFQESNNEIEAAENNVKKAFESNLSDIHIYEVAGNFYMRQHRYDDVQKILENALELPGSKLDIYIQLGNLELTRRQVEKAITWYELAKLEDQSDVKPYLALSAAYQEQGDYDTALAALYAARQFEPANVEVNIASGELLMKSGSSLAGAYFENAVLLDQSNVASLLALADVYKSQENWTEAINLLEKAVNLNPTNLIAYTSLAQTYQMMNDCSSAESVITTGVENTADKQNGYLSAALVYEGCGNWDNAQKYYELAWSNGPNTILGGLELAHYLLRQNEEEQALTTLGLIESQTGLDSRISNLYGDIYSSHANWRKAEEAYNQAILLDSSNKDGYSGLANIYELQGKLDEAADLYAIAAESVSLPLDVELKLGSLLMRQGKYEEAQAAFQKALELDAFNFTGILNTRQPGILLDDPEEDIFDQINRALMAPTSKAYTTIAQLYQLEGKSSEAYSWFQKAIRLEPKNSGNWFSSGNYYKWLGDWEKALEFYTEAIKYNPNSVENLVAMGSAQEELYLYDDAKKTYLQAINDRPKVITGYVSLARLQLLMGDHEAALNTIQEGITQAPGDYRGYETLGDIYLTLEPDNLKQAEEAYTKGLIILPGSVDLYVKMGNLHINRVTAAWEKLEEAMEYGRWAENQITGIMDIIGFEREIYLQPRFYQNKLNIMNQEYQQAQTEIYLAQLDYDQTADSFAAAEKNYLTAVSLDANSVQALQGLGKLKCASGSESECISYFEKAYAMNPFSSAAFISMGNLYNEVGQADRAVKILEMGVSREPDNSSAQAALSNAYYGLPLLSVSQAARSVEQSTYKLEAMVMGLRQKTVTR